MRRVLTAVLLACAAAPLAHAQDFRPPDPARRPAADSGTARTPQAMESNAVLVGVLGFSTRVGAQVTQDGQAILGSTVDLMQLWSPRVRFRPSAEVGFGQPDRSLGVNAEIVFRFQPETAPAIPYVGTGVGYYDDGTVERVWPTFVLGFELPYQRGLRWLVEYHALDGLRRSRFLVGLAAGGGH